MSTINNVNSPNLNAAFDIAKNALSLAKDLNNGDVTAAIQDMASMFQGAVNLANGSTGSNASQGAAMSSKISTADLMKAFGMDEESKQKNEAKQVAAAGKGSVDSLAGLLALIGKKLVDAQQKLADKLVEQANILDQQAASGKGQSFAATQKLNELSQALQDVKKALDNVVQMVSNLSKGTTDANAAVIRNMGA